MGPGPCSHNSNKCVTIKAILSFGGPEICNRALQSGVPDGIRLPGAGTGIKDYGLVLQQLGGYPAPDLVIGRESGFKNDSVRTRAGADHFK